MVPSGAPQSTLTISKEPEGTRRYIVMHAWSPAGEQGCTLRTQACTYVSWYVSCAQGCILKSSSTAEDTQCCSCMSERQGAIASLRDSKRCEPYLAS
jgi:hypothetical protein